MELAIRVILAVVDGFKLRWPLFVVFMVSVSAGGGICFAYLGGSFWPGFGYLCAIYAGVYVLLSGGRAVWAELF